MAGGSSISISGLADLEKQLDKLSKSVGKNALNRSLKRAAEPTADLAKSLAPERKGNLKNSIIVGKKLAKSQAKAHRKMFRNDRQAVELFVGPSYLSRAGGRHGHLVEFGTKPHINKGKFAGTLNPGTRPQPFMRPAWDKDKTAMLERLTSDLALQIFKSVARAELKAAKAQR
jgi:HK97 gp10 family phage protein